MKKVYLDNSATTPVDSRVLKVMEPYFSDQFGNASSIHSFGQEARAAVDESREKIAEFLNCDSSEIVFTSGGSESDNLAIKGVVESLYSKSRKPHVITSQIEHHAVLDTIKELEKDGKIEATYIKPNKAGIINPKSIKDAIKKNTILVSIMYVNNEIGTIQPIREIGKLIEKANSTRKADQKIYFHSDAVQASGFLSMDTKYLHLDLFSISAHKIYGPKGVGLLFAREGTPIRHQIIGGGQEYKMRAGTENVAGIVGFAKSIEVVQENDNEKMKKLRDRLIDGLLKIKGSRLNGSREMRSPNNVNISFENAEGESMLINLDMAGVAASSGSACTSGSLEPSHVLTAIGVPKESSHGSVRFTLGKMTTKEDVDYVIKIMPKIVEKLRKMSPF